MRTEDLILSPESRNYLIMGPAGSGKTTLLGTFQPPDYDKNSDKPWCKILAMDLKKHGGMSVLAGIRGIDFSVMVDDIGPKKVTSVQRPAKLDKPKAADMFRDEHEILMGLPDPFPYYMVALDTVTGLTTALMNEVMYTQRSNPEASLEFKGRSRPALNEIGDCQWYLYDYVSNLLQLPCIVVVTAHTAMETDADRNTRHYPKLPGVKLYDPFLALFDEVYYTEADANGNYRVRTKRTMAIPARTSQAALDDIEVPDFQVWLRKMRAHFALQERMRSKS